MCFHFSSFFDDYTNAGLLTDWYKQFNVEEKFGFNKSNPRLWVSDKIKENLLGFLFGTLIFALLIWLYRTLSSFSSYWWLIAFCTFFLVQLSMMILWPKFILPLFNKLSPLEDGDLKKDFLIWLKEPDLKPKR